MPHTCDSFLEDYPEFINVPRAVVARWLKASLLMLDRGVWGKWHDLARGLWVAHYLALDYDVSAAIADMGLNSPYETGTVSSMSASTGGLSVTRAAPALAQSDNPYLADYARTAYGMKFLSFLYAVVPSACLVYSPDTSDSGAG